jgi:hypothetical protein
MTVIPAIPEEEIGRITVPGQQGCGAGGVFTRPPFQPIKSWVQARCHQLTPIILATQEAEIKIAV